MLNVNLNNQVVIFYCKFKLFKIKLNLYIQDITTKIIIPTVCCPIISSVILKLKYFIVLVIML